MSPQQNLILQHLRSGKTLTSMRAFHELNIVALSQRIGELRRSGIQIKSRPYVSKNGVHLTEYYLDDKSTVDSEF